MKLYNELFGVKEPRRIIAIAELNDLITAFLQSVVLEESDKSDAIRQKKGIEKHYTFDVVFNETSFQEEVYDVTTRSLVKDVLNG